MTDRELLELAAKAAGLSYIKPLPEYSGRFGLEVGSENPMRCQPWNPLNDDGDALRLAVKLGLCIHHDDHEPGVTVWHELDHEWVATPHGGDPYAATRRAIVLAAAEIGKAMT